MSSSKDFTRAVNVKRNAKKKSEYEISEEEEGEYVLSAVPDDATVNVGDKVVAINGVKIGDIDDEDEATEIMNSIRIVVVPADDIPQYEQAKAREENGDAIVSADGKIDIRCPHCDHYNEGLEVDEDGDYVCENCGTILDVPKANDSSKDEIYECPDCGHKNVNPEPDEDGDRVCEECGCILPEKLRVECDKCGYENVDPQADENGDHFCARCGEKLDVEEAKQSMAERVQAMYDKYAEQEADGQEFGEDGKPVTNPEGKKLTPAEMFKPGDVITVTVGKSNPKQDAGLKVERAENGKYYVRKVPPSGLFAKTPVIAGDKILELNGVDSKDYEDINQMKRVIRDEEKLTIVVLRREPDASESSADSDIDFDNLAPITPDGVMREEIEEKDDDTLGYDGHDCGCIWCPVCHPIYRPPRPVVF